MSSGVLSNFPVLLIWFYWKMSSRISNLEEALMPCNPIV